MARRGEVVGRVAALAGGDVLRITDPGSGWPALGELIVNDMATRVALFVATVGLSHRGRDEVERRFQNPGGDWPISETRPDRDALLLGLWESDPLFAVDRPVLVSADPVRRMGRTTRFSVFASMTALQTASLDRGWSEEQSASGESIRCLLPPLLPLSYEADRYDAAPAPLPMQAAIEGSGLLTASEPEVQAASQRARRAGSTLVRDARFSRRTVDAYQGMCAMCGLGVGLVQGAHIYPVSAPGSPDEPRNGLALCANHHLAFDRHLVGVRPNTFEIVFHRRILDQLSASPPIRALVDGTFDHLAAPAEQGARPLAEMFDKRYDFFAGHYDWLARH